MIKFKFILFLNTTNKQTKHKYLKQQLKLKVCYETWREMNDIKWMNRHLSQIPSMVMHFLLWNLSVINSTKTLWIKYCIPFRSKQNYITNINQANENTSIKFSATSINPFCGFINWLNCWLINETENFMITKSTQ